MTQYTNWTVLHENGRDKKGHILFLCECKCGIQKNVRSIYLQKNPNSQCRTCMLKERNNVPEMAGKRFGQLTVIEQIKNKRRELRYKCQCDCGKKLTALGYRLRNGKTSSCNPCSKKNHGMSSTDTYGIWHGLFYRCNNENAEAYKYYGARGIKVCERWKKFENFLEDMGIRPKGLSLDRINNDGPYEPSNCRWATAKEQAINRRPSIRGAII